MKKFIFGIITSTLIFSAYNYGGSAISLIRGPEANHRLNGLKSVSGSVADQLFAINPKTGEVAQKSLRSTNVTFYLDQPSENSQYARWKTNNIYAYDIEYHMVKTYPLQSFQQRSPSYYWTDVVFAIVISSLILIIFIGLSIMFIGNLFNK